ncbi:hypothetical protein IAU59_000959 [Kwoniella sp. CBS 9459]
MSVHSSFNGSSVSSTSASRPDRTADGTGLGVTLNLYAAPLTAHDSSRRLHPGSESGPSSPSYQIFPEVTANEAAASRGDIFEPVAELIHTTLNSITDYLNSEEGVRLRDAEGTFVPIDVADPGGPTTDTRTDTMKIGEQAREGLRMAVSPFLQGGIEEFKKTTGETMNSSIVFDQQPTRGPFETALESIEGPAGPLDWNDGDPWASQAWDPAARRPMTSSLGSNLGAGGSDGHSVHPPKSVSPSAASLINQDTSNADDEVYSVCGSDNYEVPDIPDPAPSDFSGANPSTRRNLSGPAPSRATTSVFTNHWIQQLHNNERTATLTDAEAPTTVPFEGGLSYPSGTPHGEGVDRPDYS